MGLQLPPGAVMMKLDHQHIQGVDIQGCFGVAIQQSNGLKILTVGGISNLESLAAGIYSRLIEKNQALFQLGDDSFEYLEQEEVRESLRSSARQSIEAAVIFKQVLMDRAKEEAKSNAETQLEG